MIKTHAPQRNAPVPLSLSRKEISALEREINKDSARPRLKRPRGAMLRRNGAIEVSQRRKHWAATRCQVEGLQLVRVFDGGSPAVESIIRKNLDTLSNEVLRVATALKSEKTYRFSPERLVVACSMEADGVKPSSIATSTGLTVAWKDLYKYILNQLFKDEALIEKIVAHVKKQ